MDDGTETQIISQEIYNQIDSTDQMQKFVAIIVEKDERGNPFVPTFLKSRIYIDMSDSTLRAENFEQLLRWTFDKPLYKKPERGKPPAYLFEEREIRLGTTSRFRQAKDALKQNKASAPGVCQEYFNTFAENLEKFQIEPKEGKEFDDQVIENIEAFLPYRDEAIELFLIIAMYRSDSEFCALVHGFFEQLMPYVGLSTWNEEKNDNFRFILNELFIYAIAAFLKNGRFNIVNEMLEQDYYLHSDPPEEPEGKMVSFTHFNTFPHSFRRRNERLNLNRLSLMADILEHRAKRYDLKFSDVMQADFVLYLRSELQFQGGWWPHTLLYTTFMTVGFEIFARAQSKRYFNQLKMALGINDKDELLRLLEEYRSDPRKLPRWEGHNIINPGVLMNIDAVATKP